MKTHENHVKHVKTRGETGRRGSFQAGIKRPEPPSFAEPADGTKAALPRALQAGGGMLGVAILIRGQHKHAVSAEKSMKIMTVY